MIKDYVLLLSNSLLAATAVASPSHPVDVSVSVGAARIDQKERCDMIAAAQARGSKEYEGAQHAAELATCAAIAAIPKEGESVQRKRVFEKRMVACRRVPVPASFPYPPEHFLVPIVLGVLNGDPELGPDEDFLNLCRGYLQGRIDERDRARAPSTNPFPSE